LNRRIQTAELLAAALSRASNQEMDTLVTSLESGYWSIPAVPRTGLAYGRRASTDTAANRSATLVQQDDLITDVNGGAASYGRLSTKGYFPRGVTHKNPGPSTMGCSERPGRCIRGFQPRLLQGEDSLSLSKDERPVQSERRPSTWISELKARDYGSSQSGNSNTGSQTSQETAFAILEDMETCSASVCQPEVMISSQVKAKSVTASTGQMHLPDSRLCSRQGSADGGPLAAKFCVANSSVLQDQVDPL
jgi:hypothetical protein